MGATRLNLHAIAVLGVKPEPLRGRLAMSGLEYISRMRGAAHPSARRWLFCFWEFCWRKRPNGRLSSAKLSGANMTRRTIAVTRKGRSEAEDPP